MKDAWQRQSKVLQTRQAMMNKDRRHVTFNKGDLIMLWEPPRRTTKKATDRDKED